MKYRLLAQKGLNKEKSVQVGDPSAKLRVNYTMLN